MDEPRRRASPGRGALVRVAAIAAIAIAALVAAVLVRAQNFNSVQIEVAAVPRIALDEARLASHLAAAIRFRTVSETAEDTPEKLEELKTCGPFSSRRFHACTRSSSARSSAARACFFAGPAASQT